MRDYECIYLPPISRDDLELPNTPYQRNAEEELYKEQVIGSEKLSSGFYGSARSVSLVRYLNICLNNLLK